MKNQNRSAIAIVIVTGVVGYILGIAIGSGLLSEILSYLR